MWCKCFMLKCSFLLLFCIFYFFSSHLSRRYLVWGKNMNPVVNPRLWSFISIIIAEGRWYPKNTMHLAAAHSKCQLGSCCVKCTTQMICSISKMCAMYHFIHLTFQMIQLNEMNCWIVLEWHLLKDLRSSNKPLTFTKVWTEPTNDISVCDIQKLNFGVHDSTNLSLTVTRLVVSATRISLL